MSEWTQMACGAAASVGATVSFAPLQIRPQGANPRGAVDSAPGATTRFHIYDDPAYFGNARPTALLLCLGTLGRSIVRLDNGSVIRDWNGSVTAYLWANANRDTGVWARISEELIDPAWLHGSLQANFDTVGTLPTDFLTPIPSAAIYVPGEAMAFGISRKLEFGIAGQAAVGTYDLTHLPASGLQLEIAVTQFPDEETATCIVGDFSEIGYHYAFDSGMSFLPEGFISPFTLASVDIYSIASYVMQDGTSVSSTGPRLRANDVIRYCAGQFENYHHDGHFPEPGQQRFFRGGASNGFNALEWAPLKKPRNGGLPSRSSNVAYQAAGYTTNRAQFSVGNFSVPKQAASGHWTIFPSSSEACSGDLTLSFAVDQSASPGTLDASGIKRSAGLSTFDGLAISVTNTGRSGMQLASNSGYAEQLAASQSSGPKTYGLWSPQTVAVPVGEGSKNEAQYDTLELGGSLPPFDLLFTQAGSGFTFYAFPTYEALEQAYYAAIQSGQEFFVDTRGFQIPIPFRVAYENHYILQQMQCFCRLHFGNKRTLIQPTALLPTNEPPSSAISVSGNLDAWQKGAPAPVLLHDRLHINAVVRAVARAEARNAKVIGFPIAQITQVRARIQGEPFVAFDAAQLENTFRFQQHAFVAIDYTFTPEETAILRAGGVVTIGAYEAYTFPNAYTLAFDSSLLTLNPGSQLVDKVALTCTVQFA